MSHPDNNSENKKAPGMAAELLLPIPMLLSCPSCNTRHIDLGEFATRLHHTHACQVCGMVWRPAIVPTVGVKFLPGYQNAENSDGSVKLSGSLESGLDIGITDTDGCTTIGLTPAQSRELIRKIKQAGLLNERLWV